MHIHYALTQINVFFLLLFYVLMAVGLVVLWFYYYCTIHMLFCPKTDIQVIVVRQRPTLRPMNFLCIQLCPRNKTHREITRNWDGYEWRSKAEEAIVPQLCHYCHIFIINTMSAIASFIELRARKIIQILWFICLRTIISI